jgi:hypothetical protein
MLSRSTTSARPFIRCSGTNRKSIGSEGVAEDFLDPVQLRGKPVTTYWAESKKADRGGELFLYVNGPVLPLPWIADVFYRRHVGEARIVIERES